MPARMPACLHACLHADTHACTHARTHARMLARTHARTNERTHAHTHTQCAPRRRRTRTHCTHQVGPRVSVAVLLCERASAATAGRVGLRRCARRQRGAAGVPHECRGPRHDLKHVGHREAAQQAISEARKRAAAHLRKLPRSRRRRHQQAAQLLWRQLRAWKHHAQRRALQGCAATFSQQRARIRAGQAQYLGWYLTPLYKHHLNWALADGGHPFGEKHPEALFGKR
eukprot:93652-Chlamydomonas_euryale.AAC.2